jgi:hypothetical protein
VRAKLVAAAAIVVLALGYFLGLWSDLGRWLGGLWYLLAGSTLVPNWLLGVFALCAIVVAGLLGAGLRPVRDTRRPSPISTQDNFFNIRWRWSYDSSGGVQDLTPFCQRCGSRLVLKQLGNAQPTDRYECRCDRCGAVACEIDCSVEEFESRVLHKIHQSTAG